MCISVAQLVRNIDKAVFADIAVFTGLQHLSVISNIYIHIYKVGPRSYEPLWKMGVHNSEISVTLKLLRHNDVLHI